MDNTDALIKFGSWSGWELGSFSSYEILKDGVIKLTVNIAGTAITLTDTLSKEELDKVNKFVSESNGEYESKEYMDAGAFIVINGKEYDNADELNEKFNVVLDEILQNHYVFTKESVSHVYDILETNKDLKVSKFTDINNVNKMLDDYNKAVGEKQEENSKIKVDELVNTLQK